MNQNSKRATSDRHRLIFTLQAISGERPARLILWEDWVFPTFEVKLNRKETPLSANGAQLRASLRQPASSLVLQHRRESSWKKIMRGPVSKKNSTVHGL